MAKKACLDYGHGGKDPGAINGNLKEKDLTLSIGKKVKSILENHNVTVITTRDTDKYLSLTERANIANKNNVDVFVSIHINSFSNSTANGVETFSSVGSYEGARLAKMVQGELVSTKLFKSDRGIKTAKFTVLVKPYAPSILTELGFISNPDDAKVMQNKQNELATAIAKGILKYLGIGYKATQSTPKAPINNNLRYGSRGQAVNKLQADLKKLGYDITVGGAYGKETQKAVEVFQSRHVGVRRSGEVDETTLQMIENDLKVVQFYKDNK